MPDTSQTVVPITDSAALADFCAAAARSHFVAVDTEFVRDNTYWPQLCLVQIASGSEAVVVDPLAEGMDLAPLFALMADSGTLKVFHAAKQDIEIFFQQGGAIPAPLFDTQVAAMVCGFGDQISYDQLAQRLTGQAIDKTARFADWSRRPLSQKQLSYALADVVYLRPIYEALAKKLHQSGREEWLHEEMAALTDPATYDTTPENAWLRIKRRTGNRRFLAVLQHLAAWRERLAQDRNVPRNRVLRDEAMLDIAAQAPTTADKLGRIRGFSPKAAAGRQGVEILEVVAAALAQPKESMPQPERRDPLPLGIGPVTDLLKVLLKHVCERHGVAPRLIASSDDLQQIAADDHAEVPALHGWRRELFGDQALALKHGRLSIAVENGQTRVIDISHMLGGKD